MNDKIPGRLSTLCGGVLALVINLDPGNLITTAILGAVGTIVSYAVTRLLKALFE
jgi:hypothetical protein